MFDWGLPLVSGRKASRAPRGRRSVTSELNFPELGNNYDFPSPALSPLPTVCPPQLFSSPSRFDTVSSVCRPGAQYTPLFIYVWRDGHGLPLRKEGWDGGDWDCVQTHSHADMKHMKWTAKVILNRKLVWWWKAVDLQQILVLPLLNSLFVLSWSLVIKSIFFRKIKPNQICRVVKQHRCGRLV